MTAQSLCANCKMFFSFNDEGAEDEWGTPLCGTCWSWANDVKVYVTSVRDGARADAEAEKNAMDESFTARIALVVKAYDDMSPEAFYNWCEVYWIDANRAVLADPPGGAS